MLRWLANVWDLVREGYFFIKPIRFSVFPLVLLAWALISAAQEQDSVRFLGVSPQPDAVQKEAAASEKAVKQ